MSVFFTSIYTLFSILGSSCLFLYGLKAMSDGLQKASGNKLQNTLSLMTKNRFVGILTGAAITALIQSSSATTVMVVSFANAGLITLRQSIGVIMGANIGTTITAWLVSISSIMGKFNIILGCIIILAFMLPLLFSKKPKLNSIAEAMVGLTIIFIGLKFLQDSMPITDDSPQLQNFLMKFSANAFRWYHVLLFVFVGAIITALVQSSSAVTAIAIALVVQGIFPFKPIAALVLGCNIGTTITAWLASIGANTNAKRASMAHILFNFFGAVWVIILFKPFVSLVELLSMPLTTLIGGDLSLFSPALIDGHIIQDKITPAVVESARTLLATANINFATFNDFEIVNQAFALMTKKHATIQVSVFHTLFNFINASILIGFIPHFAKLIEKLVPTKAGNELNERYQLRYISTSMQDTPENNIQIAKVELKKMTEITISMFALFLEVLDNPDKKIDEAIERLKKQEDYTDQMQEAISEYLQNCSQENLTPNSRHNVNSMIRISHELENIGDSCFNLGILTQRKYDMQILFTDEMREQLRPFIAKAKTFLDFIFKKMNRRISEAELNEAVLLEEDVDAMRSDLRENSQNRIQEGSSVKTELIYLDLVKHIEHIGDSALNIAQELRTLK